ASGAAPAGVAPARPDDARARPVWRRPRRRASVGRPSTIGPAARSGAASGTARLLAWRWQPAVGVESAGGSRARPDYPPPAEPLRVLRRRRAQRDDVLDRRHDRGGRAAGDDA